MSPTLQDLSNDTTFSKIKSRVPDPLKASRTYFVINVISDEAFTKPASGSHTLIDFYSEEDVTLASTPFQGT